MSEVSPHSADCDANLRVFDAELRAALPFREDAQLLAALADEIPPVLSALARDHRAATKPPAAQGHAALTEGFALFNLLCRRAGLLGATPTVALALARATIAALKSEGLALSTALMDDLAVIAVEGYCAGRDELRERGLRTIALESQVFFAFAPRCFGVFLAGSHLSEALERVLDDLARQLFRAEARSVLLDISRLREAGEENARSIVSFATTLLGLGARVLIYESASRFDAWFVRLALSGRGVERSSDFAEALTRTLSGAGYELRARGRLGGLIDKVRAGAR